ncbi:MAG: hypothetical protein Q7U04_13690, partial [Bacteriovorax sp.]|nr:hypothetical protein [Bacteriovorax sp.]
MQRDFDLLFLNCTVGIHMPVLLRFFALNTFIAAFIFINSTCKADESAQSLILQKISQLRNKSEQSSPDLKIVRNARSQKGAESYTRFTNFLPQANFNIKKDKDFFESR